MTSWVRSGAKCACVQQDWHDFFSDEEVAGPHCGDRCVVAEHSVIDGTLFIKVMGDSFFYEASAFVPIIDELDDIEMIRGLLTGSSAPSHESEHACSG